jgi:hypothetical protein
MILHSELMGPSKVLLWVDHINLLPLLRIVKGNMRRFNEIQR